MRLTIAGASLRFHFAHSGANRRGFLARSAAAAAPLAAPALCALLLAGTRHKPVPRADSKPRRAGNRGAKHPGHSETDRPAFVGAGRHGVDPAMGRSVPHDAEHVPYFIMEKGVMRSGISAHDARSVHCANRPGRVRRGKSVRVAGGEANHRGEGRAARGAAVVRELGNGGGCGFGDAEQLRDGV